MATENQRAEDQEAVSGAGALRLLTEVRARRAAWRSYEQRLSGTSEAIPGETVRIGAGDRCPLAGGVIEGAGTGAFLGLRSAVGLERGSHPTYIAALVAIGVASVRLAGGGANTGYVRDTSGRV